MPDTRFVRSEDIPDSGAGPAPLPQSTEGVRCCSSYSADRPGSAVGVELGDGYSIELATGRRVTRAGAAARSRIRGSHRGAQLPGCYADCMAWWSREPLTAAVLTLGLAFQVASCGGES